MTTLYRLVAALWLVGIFGSVVGAQEPIVFRKVDYFETEGDKEKKRDARLVLDAADRVLSIADEKKGAEKRLYASIPYDAVSKVIYERASHRRYGAAVLVNPLFLFTKGKKHWLTMEFQGVAALPQNFIYLRLDKDNFRQILSALGAGLGVEVEELIEES